MIIVYGFQSSNSLIFIGITKVDGEIYEAASIDGASPGKCFGKLHFQH